MSAKATCPQAVGHPHSTFEFLNKPDDGTCDFCGSLDADVLMARLEVGDVELGPTDKNYKVYVKNAGGATFRQSHRTDKPAKVGEVVKDPNDQSLWTWETVERQECKFYFEHLSDDQRKRFVELLNAKKIKIGEPGYFYRLPFFVTKDPVPASSAG